MKRNRKVFIGLVMTFVMIMSFVGCGGMAQNLEMTADVTEATQTENEVKTKKNLLDVFEKEPEMSYLRRLFCSISKEITEVEFGIWMDRESENVNTYSSQPGSFEITIPYSSKYYDEADKNLIMNVHFDGQQLMYVSLWEPDVDHSAILYCTGYYLFEQKEYPNDYTGYYWNNGHKSGGTVVFNGNETGLTRVDKPEEALEHLYTKEPLSGVELMGADPKPVDPDIAPWAQNYVSGYLEGRLVYNEKGLIYQIYIQEMLSEAEEKLRYEFVYDENDRPMRVNVYNGGIMDENHLTEYIDFYRDENQRIARRDDHQMSMHTKKMELMYYRFFEYDENGNMTKMDEFALNYSGEYDEYIYDGNMNMISGRFVD